MLRTEKEILSSWGNETPLVSICCLTYNHEKYVFEALNSFLDQKTDFPFEIVIHDDASTDNTANIIKQYQDLYPNIVKPLLQKENQRSKFHSGMNPRFNFPRCNGEFIAMCDGDDYWTDPLKLQKQVDFLQENMDYVLVGTYANVHKGNKLQIPKKIEFCSFNFYDIGNKFSIPTLTYCFRNQYNFKNFNYPVGDMGLSFEISKDGGKMGKLPFVSGVYNYHGGGVNSSKSRFDNIKLQFKTLYLMGKNTDDYYFKILMRWCFFKVGIKELKAILLLRHRNFKIFSHSLSYFFKI